MNLLFSFNAEYDFSKAAESKTYPKKKETGSHRYVSLISIMKSFKPLKRHTLVINVLGNLLSVPTLNTLLNVILLVVSMDSDLKNQNLLSAYINNTRPKGFNGQQSTTYKNLAWTVYLKSFAIEGISYSEE